MATWFSKNLGDAMLAGEALHHIKTLFLAQHPPLEKSTDCQNEESNLEDSAPALFLRHESEGQLHCDVKLYFTPSTASLAEELGATPCGKPSRDSLSLFVGSEHAWSVYF
ncbi:MAG: hypothetical protein M0Q95_04205 [Porticoccaceae bacterium]|nr:hypothetical protein [Porticoccaceae bacterium]